MAEITKHLKEQLASGGFTTLAIALAVLVVGLVLARFLSVWLGRAVEKRGSPQGAMVARRLTYWTLVALIVAVSLKQAGLDLSILMGAAGVLTVAIGFASQTSASNLISGLFLIGERPFVIGDIIRVGSTVGVVVAVDLMSVKLRTFDNLFVRMPNETLLKSEITNLTRFPIRRVDVSVGVAYREDIERVREVLMGVADSIPIALDEPRPLFKFVGFGDSSVNLELSVWGASENFLELKTTLHLNIKRAFDEARIEIPFPHRTLYTGSRTEPMPVRMVGEGDASPAGEPAGAVEGSPRGGP